MASSALVAGEAPRCEACKWAAMSHQPVGGPQSVPLGRAATAGAPVRAYAGPRVEVPQVVYAGREPGNLLACAAWAAGAALVTGVGIYLFQVVTGDNGFYLYALLGLIVANAAWFGNDREVTVDTRWIGAVISAVAALVIAYFCARQASIADLERHGIHAPLPLVVQWNQLTYLLSHADGLPWWSLALIAGGFSALPHRFRRRSAATGPDQPPQ